MSTGQMLLVLGAVTLLSTLSLTINTMLIGQTTAMLDAETSLNAISLAQNMLDEVLTKSYDAATVTSKVYQATSFTAVTSLGPNNTEASNVRLPDVSYPKKSLLGYNDVDDYHNYTRIDSSSRFSNFTITDSIFYVSETNPDVKSASQTFFKKIVVTVRHQNMTKPLQLSDVAVYRRYF